MKRKKAYQSLFDSGYRLFKVDSNTKKPTIRNWQKGACIKKRSSFREADVIGFLPHWHGYVVIDIDYHPSFESRKAFMSEGIAECRRLLKEFIGELEKGIPDFRRKLVHWNYSGSGYGAHLYFKTPPSFHNESKHADFMERKKHQLGWCDIFDGGGFVIIHDPCGFRKSIRNYGLCEDIEEDDLQWILSEWPRVSKSNSKPRRPKSTINPFNGSVRFIDVIGSIAGSRIDVPLAFPAGRISRSGRPITWSPVEIAIAFDKIDKSNWQRREFRIEAGMALHNIGKDLLLLDIFIGFLNAVGYTDLKPRETWQTFKRKENSLSMARMLKYAGYKDYSCAENWFQLRVKHEPGASIHIKTLYSDYIKYNPCGHGMSAFTRFFNKKIEYLTKRGPKRVAVQNPNWGTRENLTPPLEIPTTRPGNSFRYYNLTI